MPLASAAVVGADQPGEDLHAQVVLDAYVGLGGEACAEQAEEAIKALKEREASV